jgi:hypothetical protein
VVLTPWVGVLLVGIGNHLHFSAPHGSLRWLLVVLYAAWVGQVLGDQALGGYLSGVLCGYPLYRSLAQTVSYIRGRNGWSSS